MTTISHEDDIFKEKRKPKNPIKFKLQLNEEQKEAKAKILDNTVTLLAGAAGSGKTLLACQIALDRLFMREVTKVIITRPTVSKEEIGFLPGDLREKMDPWVQPIYQNMFLLYDKDKIEKCINENQVEIVPVSFMRGRTFVNCVVIVDEFQNMVDEELHSIITRVGDNCKIIFCGDCKQNDLKKETSGFHKFIKILSSMNSFGTVEFNISDIVRSSVVKEYIIKREQFETNKTFLSSSYLPA